MFGHLDVAQAEEVFQVLTLESPEGSWAFLPVIKR